MENSDIAKILYEISEYLEMEDVEFKPRAYEKAAIIIGSLEENVSEIYKRGGLKALEKIPTIGKGIGQRIEELLKTGKSKYYQKLKKKMPVDLNQLTAVEEIGPKTVKKLYKDLKIKDLKDLEKAAKTGKIQRLEDFGIKSEENILQGIEFLKQSKGRFALGFILSDVRKIEARIKEFPGVKKAIIAGSIRRMKETVGDGDLLVAVSGPPRARLASKRVDSRVEAGPKIAEKVSNFFVNMPEVIHVYAHGSTKSSVRLKNNIDFDLRVVAEESFGAALQYFTGSKVHNIVLRKIAMKKGFKLNEYGLFSSVARQKASYGGPAEALREGGRVRWKRIAGVTEEEIYNKLGLQWIPPEMREDTGEIQAARLDSYQARQAQNNQLPELIKYNDLKGDLQMHTTWSDGANSIEEMAREAMKLGLEYIVITDHTKSLPIAGGLDEKGIERQGKEIDKINTKLKDFKILKGSEVDILKDGRLDIKDEVLKKLDVVGIAVHSNLKMPKKQMTERVIKAMKNPNVDILFHPTGRLINQRPASELDIEKIIRVAKETKTVLEINAHINRLDLKDEYARMAKEAGVKLSIDSDSHSVSHFQYLKLGIGQARRGWVEKKDVINAWPMEKMIRMLKH